MLNRSIVTIGFLLGLLFFTTSCSHSSAVQIASPDESITTTITVDTGIAYSINYKGTSLLHPSKIGVLLADSIACKDFEIIDTENDIVTENWERVWGKRSIVSNAYEQTIIHLKEKESGLLFDVYVRAYNDGVAFRYGLPKQANFQHIKISSETTTFNFTENHEVWCADYKTFESPQEEVFQQLQLSDVAPKQLLGMPMLLKANDSTFMAITEANLTNWSGAFLQKEEATNVITTTLTPLPSSPTIAVERNTPAVSPWRVIMIGDTAGAFINSDIIANLNNPVAIADSSWIQPGAAAWDWWWSNSYAPDVDFEVGPNQQTMQYYIDFAAEMGWEYQIVDWQWYGEPFGEDGANPDVDITQSIDQIDIPSLVAYAKAKNVRLIIWLHWESLQKQLDEALALYEKWGVAGIKVDFMNRQDQEMVNFYHEVVAKAAQHHLLVDFHGAYKPTGVSRTYPNLITREGVMGNEHNKWSDVITPEHNVTLAFTRGILGEMDYTPVGFRNVTPEAFLTEDKTDDGSPRVQTTRCHQLAMPVVYESAFTVFCDAPANYKQGSGLEYLKDFPTTWKDTRVLQAAVGDYILMARKSGEKWYVGGLNDATPRSLKIDCSFLDEGTYTMRLFKDAEDVATNPSHIEYSEFQVSANDTVVVKVASGGGLAAIIYQK